MEAIRKHPAARGAAPYVCMLLLGLAVLFLPEKADIHSVRRAIWIGMAGAAAIWLVLRRSSGKAAGVEGLIVLMIVMGLLLRIGYGLYTPAWERQHDIGLWAGGTLTNAEMGHARYIGHYIENWRPIRDTFWQFHHPPLYHFISGKLAAVLLALGRTPTSVPESLQLFGTAVSGMTLVVCLRLFRRLGLQGGPLAAAMALMCFHPTFIILSGSVNNDNLMVFFVLAAALLTLRWDDAPTVMNTLLLALAIGLGMMTKLSAFQIAPVTAVFMLRKLYVAARGGKAGPLMRKLGLFFTVCVPLGMWYPLYIWKTFGLSPGYVPPSGMVLYTGDAGLAARFLTIPAESLSVMPYCVIDPNVDYNVWTYLFKCSLFGEYTFTGVSAGFATAFVYLNIALIALSLVCMLYVLCVRKSGVCAGAALFLLGVWGTQLVFFLYFNLKLPFVPTMDFRYVVPALAAGAGFIALGAQHLRERRARLWRFLRIPAGGLIAAFAVFSAVFYLSVNA